MKRLFIELYLDEDVDVLIAGLLRAHGFVATTARETDMLGRDDEEQLAYAASQSKAILTHNRVDFEDLAKNYLAKGQMHYGIVLAGRRSPYEVARRLLILLDSVTADEMQNQVRWI